MKNFKSTQEAGKKYKIQEKKKKKKKIKKKEIFVN